MKLKSVFTAAAINCYTKWAYRNKQRQIYNIELLAGQKLAIAVFICRPTVHLHYTTATQAHFIGGNCGLIFWVT
jgi:hypothetical protein